MMPERIHLGDGRLVALADWIQQGFADTDQKSEEVPRIVDLAPEAVCGVDVACTFGSVVFEPISK